jgi:multidrug efflux pump
MKSDGWRVRRDVALISRFFINRPIFASVLSIGITLLGAVTLYRLPLAQYPPVTPPIVQVD